MRNGYLTVSLFYLTIILFLSSLVIFNPEPGNAEEDPPSADEIVEMANHVSYYQGKGGRAKVHMTITDSQGRKRNREFTILRRDDLVNNGQLKDGEQKFYIFFHRPADVNKMVFLVWKHLDRDDDRWLYLPGLDLVKRIAASDERTSFVGSDFFYEDVSGRGVHDDRHELVKTTKNFFALKHVPKDPSSVEFSYYQTWIHRKTFIPVKIEYFNKNGEKYRLYEALKVETIDNYPTVVKSKMKDLRTDNQTEMSYSGVRYNLELPDNIFTERFLRMPPKKFLR